MRTGKVSATEWRLLLVIMALLVVIVYASVVVNTEIPKLEKRVDELTQTIETRNAEVERLQDDLSKTTEAYGGIIQQNEQLTGELAKQKAQVDKLTKMIQVKDRAINDLRKKKTATPSRGQDYREEAVVGNSFEVTWYNDYGHTKSGRIVKDNVTIAVDPRIIPLDTWVKLEFPDGREMVRRADDTGSAVKGHIIDIYDNASTGELLERGRTHGVKVTILRKN